MKRIFYIITCFLLPVLALTGCIEQPSYRIYYYSKEFTSGSLPIDSKIYTTGESAVILGQGNLKYNDYTFLGWRYYDELRSPGEHITINFYDIRLSSSTRHG